ncbi:UNVERIFIED_CONTAM: Der1 family protein [Hammondia hammondi]|eukprot:XP_008886445.1 Der1 family protein [Hammondia hammondi]
MAQVDLFFSHLPPVTRFYLFCSTALMLLCTLEIVSPFSLYINYNLVLQRGQVWRIFSCFLFFGTFSLHFFWNVYVLIFYCATLEEHQRSATFLWMLLTTGALLLGLSHIFGVGSYFFSGSMINVMTYIWGRRNPSTRLSVFFISVSAPYLPFVLALMSVLVGWNMADHVIGILVGHVYFFFEDIYPLLPTSKGCRIFRTPRLLLWIFRENAD